MKFEILGEIVDYNPYNKVITIKCDFFTPETLGILEDMSREKIKAIKMSFNFSPKKTKQYFQQKCWYGCLKLILQAKEIDITKENLMIEDEEQRRAIFPTKTYEIDNKPRRRPKRMSECSYEEMQRNIEVLIERHQHLKIRGKQVDFSQLKLNY